MAELNTDGCPVFVDVSTDLTQLLPPSQLCMENIIKIESSSDHESLLIESKGQDMLIPKKKKFKCPECLRFTTQTEEKMVRHIRRVHRGENPFRCYMCEYSTYNKCLFEEHVRIHQGIKPFKCSHCPYRSVSKKNTKKHELIHRPDNPLRCTDCSFIARNTRSLRCHIRNKNCVVKQELERQNCSNCDFETKTKKELITHNKNKKKCKLCDVQVCTRKLLTKHMVKEHKKKLDENKIFLCSICKWSSNSKFKVLLHLIHHPEQKVDEDILDISILRRNGIML